MNKRVLQLKNFRRLCQFLCFSAFLFLFLKTDYTGQDEIQYAVNMLFRLDPFLAACASLAAHSLIFLMWPALLTILLTFLTGRSFCGWICPMGALLDFNHRFIRTINSGRYQHLRFLKYYLLICLLLGSFMGFSAAGYFDPFSILIRSLTLSLHPALHSASTSFFTFTYNNAPQWINWFTEPLYSFLKNTLLPFRQTYFELSLFSFSILAVLLLLDFIEQRFFCRNVCPLGGLLSLLSQFSFLHGQTGKKCGACRQCRTNCPMEAIDEQKNISTADCNLCMECLAQCPSDKIDFKFSKPIFDRPVVNLSRRAILGSIAAGITLPLILQTRTMAKQPDPSLIRPPGAQPEEIFTGLCVRCGECMKICIGNALQPSFLEAGIEGVFTPKINARIGYCEYNCSLCGQVCPTGAIKKVPLETKKNIKIGHAFFDKNICLPYAKGIPCIVCEEHCPTPEKAIKFRKVLVLNSKSENILVKQPYIIDALCIGCGICENKCPLPGIAAVRITSGGESRNPANKLPSTEIRKGLY
jgi:polyferredoxin